MQIHTSENQPLIPKTNGKDYSKENLPNDLLEAINNIDSTKLGTNQAEQKAARDIITNWVTTVLNVLDILFDDLEPEASQKSKFIREFTKGFINFITHKDHGITHSYCVYKGMIHLSQLDGKKIKAGTKNDRLAQLFSLLHDIMQIVPSGFNGKLANSNPKNEHARIIGALSRMFGKKLGFDSETVRELTFGLLVHDSSYRNVYYWEKLAYLYKIGHDADKIFGASIQTDVEIIAREMIARNYQANRGPNGSYVLRTDLTDSYRKKIQYGDRCMNDAVSLVRKEYETQMYTKAGEKIASERERVSAKQIISEYGRFYDLTANYISENIFPQEKVNPLLKMTIVGMDQEEKQLNRRIKNKTQLKLLINRLYRTPIQLKQAHKFIGRYSENSARGLKICVLNLATEEEIYLDPSIARFCFMQNGKKKFLKEIAKAFGHKSTQINRANQVDQTNPANQTKPN